MIDVNSLLNPSGVGNNLTQFSDSTVSYLNTMPSIVNTWQAEDIVNDDAGDYHVNPVGDIILTIKSKQELIYTTSSVVGSLSNITTAANTAANSSNNFFAHTQRISGVVSVSEDLLPELPHYDSAVQIGKSVIYLLNKNESVTGAVVDSNGPIIGNFTSLFTANDLVVFSNTCNTDFQKVNNSITAVVDPEGGGTTYTSNLTPTQISTITANLIFMTTFMDSRRANDENFFATETKMVENYNKVKGYSNPGQTENYLISNFVGSNKLKSRLNL